MNSYMVVIASQALNSKNETGFRFHGNDTYPVDSCAGLQRLERLKRLERLELCSKVLEPLEGLKRLERA